MRKPKKVGRPKKQTRSGASYKTYKKLRKQVSSKLSYASKKTGITDFKDMLLPKIPKIITEGSIRKLERLSEKLSRANKEGKLERIYSEKKRQNKKRPPEGPEPIPEFEDIVINDYIDFITSGYDDGYASAKFLEWNGTSCGPVTLQLIREHIDNCLDMLGRIGAFDKERRKTIINNLATNTIEIYYKTEKYIYSYESLFHGMGPTYLMAIEILLTREINGTDLTEKQRKDYAEILSSYGDDAYEGMFD